MNSHDLSAYWTLPIQNLLLALESSSEGLSDKVAQERQTALRSYQLNPNAMDPWFHILWNQIRSPLTLMLLIAAVISSILNDWTDATMIATIVVFSAGLGFWREYRSGRDLEKLVGRLNLTATVYRSGREQQVPHQTLVPGDIIDVCPGKVMPADCVMLTADSLYIDQAVMTGESLAVAKFPVVEGVRPETPLTKRHNCLFMGSNVYSGRGKAVVVRIGLQSEYGILSHSLGQRAPEAEFEKGLRQFGNLLLRIMLIIIVVVFGVQIIRGEAQFSSLIFALALAVGMSPELLPAILSINLATSAQRLARGGILVRRLHAIENLGSTTLLCSDKTGTLTEGVIQLQGAFDQANQPSPEVLWAAGVNAKLQTGLINPLDNAILQAIQPTLTDIKKLAEIPYDYTRKRLSVIIQSSQGIKLICKGAFDQIIKVCTETSSGQELDHEMLQNLQTTFDDWGHKGYRALAVAERSMPSKDHFSMDDERDLRFLGFLIFADQPKPGIGQTIQGLRELGVGIKVITGDSANVCRHIGEHIGMHEAKLLIGSEMDRLTDIALTHLAPRIDIFAQVDPSQKARIVLALRRAGHVVAYMGDGINDLSAMHAADTSLSVESAVEVAKATADFVFVEKNLDIVRQGIVEGRQTFANTMKYILTTTSANLGNMISMALASAVLPFLPLLAGQVLLNNLLSDIPSIGLAQDSVDPEMVREPRRWNTRFIQRFMLGFGFLSTTFDMLTFVLLLKVFQLDVVAFRTGWFIESLLTEVCVAFVVRTSRPFYRSRPNRFLIVSSALVAAAALVLPFMPFADILGFAPLSAAVVMGIIALTVAYVVCTEFAKSWLLRWSAKGTGTTRVHNRII